MSPDPAAVATPRRPRCASRAPGPVVGIVLALGVALGACSTATAPDAGTDPETDAGTVRPCSQGAPVLEAVELEPRARDNGPLLDATLWARRTPAGQACVSLEIGHADVGAEVVRAEVTAAVAGQTRTTRGGEISDLVPLRLDLDACVALRATVVLRGESGLHEHRASAEIGPDCVR